MEPRPVWVGEDIVDVCCHAAVVRLGAVIDVVMIPPATV